MRILRGRLVAIPGAFGLAAIVMLAAALIIHARSTPPPLGLPSARSSSTASTTPPAQLLSVCRRPASSAPSSRLGGLWLVQPGSVAGYRAHERIAGIDAPSEAVARTDQVAGWGMVRGSSSATVQLAASCFAVDLRTLVSQDSIPGRKMSDRDDNVRGFLQTDLHPFGLLHISDATISAAQGTTATATLSGELELNGITKPATFAVDLRVDGGQISVAGHGVVVAEDYQIELPKDALTFIDVDSHITVEFAAVLERT